MPDNEVEVWIGIAQMLYSAPCLDAERKALADAYLAAHLIKMGELTGSSSAGGGSGMVPAGPLVSEKEGDLERRYSDKGISNSGGSTSNANQTAYGQMWYSITAACAGAPIMTRIE